MMRTLNPSNYLILLISLFSLVSCNKSPDSTPPPQSKQTQLPEKEITELLTLDHPDGVLITDIHEILNDASIQYQLTQTEAVIQKKSFFIHLRSEIQELVSPSDKNKTQILSSNVPGNYSYFGVTPCLPGLISMDFAVGRFKMKYCVNTGTPVGEDWSSSPANLCVSRDEGIESDLVRTYTPNDILNLTAFQISARRIAFDIQNTKVYQLSTGDIEIRLTGKQNKYGNPELSFTMRGLYSRIVSTIR